MFVILSSWMEILIFFIRYIKQLINYNKILNKYKIKTIMNTFVHYQFRLKTFKLTLGSNFIGLF